jgi:hypothetical protein
MRTLLVSVGLAASAVNGFTIPFSPASTPAARTVAPRMDLDMGTIAGVGAALVGIGGGIGLIAFTENAGKRNDEIVNEQPCVVCKGEKVITCTICAGTGVDQYASLVAGVREEAGIGSSNKVEIEDWDEGPKQVEMYADILSKYPVKATENVCLNCDGRGVIVCDNCQGTGLQPRFLERFSPDDFMD